METKSISQADCRKRVLELIDYSAERMRNNLRRRLQFDVLCNSRASTSQLTTNPRIIAVFIIKLVHALPTAVLSASG